MGWRLNPALSAFRSAVDVRYPDRDKKSDGTIGDKAHQTRKSDHNQDADGSVDAWDMDVELNGRGKPYAEDVEHLKRVFQAHESSRYWIHDDQIAERSNGWKRRAYMPGDEDRNKHIKHIHWNTRQSLERSKAPWRLDDDEDLNREQVGQLRDIHFLLSKAVPNPSGDNTRVPLHVWAGWLTGAFKSLAIATAGADEATKAQLRKDLDGLRAQVQQATDDAVESIRGVDDIEEMARRLRPVLGDKAVAVGALLLKG
jgi:hypothetical protein